MKLPPWAPYAIGAAAVLALVVALYMFADLMPVAAAPGIAVAGVLAQQAAKSRKQTVAKVAKAERALDAEPPKKPLKARVRDGAGSV